MKQYIYVHMAQYVYMKVECLIMDVSKFNCRLFNWHAMRFLLIKTCNSYLPLRQSRRVWETPTIAGFRWTRFLSATTAAATRSWKLKFHVKQVTVDKTSARQRLGRVPFVSTVYWPRIKSQSSLTRCSFPALLITRVVSRPLGTRLPNEYGDSLLSFLR